MKKKTVEVKSKQVQAFIGKEADIDEYRDYIGKYNLKGWNFGERERIITRFANQSVDADGNTTTTVDKDEPFRLAVMERCIRMTPMKSPPTVEFLGNMPTWLGEALWKAVNKLNEQGMIGADAKKFELS